MLFRGIGQPGQEKLAKAQVAIIGCGATGSAAAALLARAGIGTLRIIDRDYVEPSNLQRQSLFDEADAAESLPKAIAAARKIAAFNSQIMVETQVADLTPSNVESLLANTGLENLRFLTPLYPGDSLRVELTVEAKSIKSEDTGQVRWAVEVFNQKEELVATYDLLTENVP